MAIQTDQFSRTLQQFIFRNFLYWNKRSVSREEETVARNSGAVRDVRQTGFVSAASFLWRLGVGLRLCVWTCDTERGSAEQPPGPLSVPEQPRPVQTDAPRRKSGHQQGGVKLRSRIAGSDAGCYDRAASPPLLLLLFFPPSLPPSPPTHHPICHSSLLSFHLLLLLLLLFVSASSLTGWLVTRCGQSGALLPDALARAAHLAVQLHHLEDGLLTPAAQMVEQTVVLLG